MMKEVSTNVNWLNPVTYIAITFPLYIFWLSLQNTFLHIDLETFLESYVSIGAVVAAVPGLYNLFVWCTQGMEGNVFGFLFFLPLLIASIFYLSMWIMALRGAYTSYEDDNGGQYSNTNRLIFPPSRPTSSPRAAMSVLLRILAHHIMQAPSCQCSSE